MLWLLRSILFIPQPKVLRDEAIRIASNVAAQNKWTCSSPKAIEELKTWFVWLNSNTKGSPFVVIDQQTGEVVRLGCPLR